MNEIQPPFSIPSVVSIAGSDCSGGAGIQADLKTFEAHHVYGQTVITALTAQNTFGVHAVLPIDATTVRAQMDAVFLDIRPQAVKIGMVATAELVEVIAERLAYHEATNVVVDPVMVATSGAELSRSDAVAATVDLLFPLAHAITPNLIEARVLTGMQIESLEEMEQACAVLRNHVAGAVVLKGGHAEGTHMTDVAYLPNNTYMHLSAPFLDNENTHGTGCTFSSALAALLAKGVDLPMALRRAKRYVHNAIAAHLALGTQRGPLDHAHQTRTIFDRCAPKLTGQPRKEGAMFNVCS